MLMLPFPKNANRYALFPVAMQSKSEKIGMWRCPDTGMDRGQASRVGGKEGKERRKSGQLRNTDSMQQKSR